MSNLFPITPELKAAAADALAADKRARREKIDPAEIARLRAILEDGGAPEGLQTLVGVVAEFARRGVPMTAIDAFRGDLVELGEDKEAQVGGAPAAHGNTWRAVLEAAFSVGKPAADAVDRAAPEVDLDRLFAGSPTVAAHAREVAARLKVAADLPALAALVIASAALAARVDGEISYAGGSTWRHPVSLMLAVEAPSGAGKSSVLAAMGDRVLEQREAEIVKAAEARVQDAKIERELLKHERARLMGAISGGKADAETSRARVREIDAILARPILGLPYFRQADTTPAQFVRRAQASGFSFLAAGEGAVILRQFAHGPDGSGDQLDALLAAYTGENYHRDRVGEAEIPRPIHPRLRAAALLLLQPGLLTPATEEEARLLERLARRGLFARALVARPRRLTRDEVLSMPGPTERAEATRRRYDAMVGFLARFGAEADPLAPEEPGVMRWADDANAAAVAFQERHKAEAEQGGEWHGGLGREEFSRRAGENVMRIAEVLRALRAAEAVTAGEDPPRELVVELVDFERARDFFVAYLVPNALAAFARATFDPISDDADRVLVVMRELGTALYSDLQRRLGRGWEKSRANDRLGRLDAALEALERRGLVVVERKQGRGGGKMIRLVAAAVAA